MPRVLIVDDERHVLRELSDALSEEGYEIDTAADGEEAIEKVKANRPHLMLLDIRMPKMDGIETLKRVMELDPALGVIMVTAVHEENLAKRAMELGAFGYITKPFDLDYLKTTVMTRINRVLG